MAATAVGLALSCAGASSQTGATGKAPEAAAPAPSASAPAAAPPAAPRPITAAEAAETAHEEWIRSRGGGGDAPAQTAQRSTPPAQAGSGTTPPAKAAPGSNPPGKGSPDDAPCSSDADCMLTRVGPDTCCASLCSPRAVTVARGAELEQRNATCQRCVDPLCRDPGRVQAACESGRCVAHQAGSQE
jgi:hypothetical protein